MPAAKTCQVMPTTSQRGYGHSHQRLRKAMGIGQGARCYWCGDFATQLDHLVAVAEGGRYGPKVPACRRCNHRRGVEVQQRLAARRRAGSLNESKPPPPPRWGRLGTRQPKRRVYPGAIEV
jgi:hypothetical protein